MRYRGRGGWFSAGCDGGRGRVLPAGNAGGGEREGDLGAAFGAVLGPDAAAVGLDDAAGDREAEAGSGAGAGAVGAPEALEHPLGGVVRDALAGVGDLDHDLVAEAAGSHGDRAVGGRVAEGVGEKVVENALDLLGG